jgi:RHS repeat-associated protein
VRALVSDIKRPDDALAGTYRPDLLAYYGYYPFGQQQPGRTAPANATLAGGYRFGFNGKEKDNNGELGLTNYDYGARIYNPGLGKFLSVDPLTVFFPWYTPFQFAGNTPIAAIDLDGEEPKVITQKAPNSSGKAGVTLIGDALVKQAVKKSTTHFVDETGKLVVKRSIEQGAGRSWGALMGRAAGFFITFMLSPANSEGKGPQGSLDELWHYERTRYEELSRRTMQSLSSHEKAELEYLRSKYTVDSKGDVVPYTRMPGTKAFQSTMNLVRWEIKATPEEAAGIRYYMDKIEAKGVESLEPIVVYRYQGIDYVMDGHHRLAAAKELGISNVPVRYIGQQEFKVRAAQMGRFSTPEGLKAAARLVEGKTDVAPTPKAIEGDLLGGALDQMW